MNNKITGYAIGVVLLFVGGTALIPAFIDYIHDHQNYRAFLECSLVSLFFGFALVIANRGFKKEMSPRQMFLLTTFSWFFMSFFSAFPLYFSDLGISFTDAFFEAVSGVTTTGSTVLSGLDEMSYGILLWRSLMQWLGGIGIIAFVIVVLPSLKIGGMQLFQTENSDRSDKVMPRTVSLVISLAQVYIFLTIACMVAYFSLGMSFFDAVNHALTTIPTGGYSTHDASFGYFESPYLHYASSFFMLLSGIPFVLFVKLFFQHKFDFYKDDQFRGLMFMLVVFIGLLTVWLYSTSDYSLLESLDYSIFNIISVITTTGFATTDYTLWGPFAVMFFLFLTYLGACAGSTAGGIKVMRLIITAKVMNYQIKKMLYPRAVFTMRYQGRVLDMEVAKTVLGFLGMFVVCNILLTIVLTWLGLDFETALSGAASALANVGPGIGAVIGPAGNYSSLPDTAKWLLGLGMILGRLEIMTIFVLLQRTYWRD